MGLKNDLEKEVQRILGERWKVREGRKVPAPDELALDANEAVKLDAAVLYADINESTRLVDGQTPLFAAEVYETYLRCAARVIRRRDGVITAYDGDRIMAVYIGDDKETRAVRTALEIHYAVYAIVNPLLKKQYPERTYQLTQVVGVDTGELHVARIGVRNDNDLVWVGRAANYAAKLCAEDADYQTYITADVYKAMADSVKYGGEKRELMWQKRSWHAMSNQTIYSSKWYYPFS